MQMMFATLDIAGGEPEIVVHKMVQLVARRKDQRERIQQTGFPPGGLAIAFMGAGRYSVVRDPAWR
jgi:hypothetical protein